MSESTGATTARYIPQVLSSLRHRNFRLLWVGLIAAMTGFWIQSVAQGWLVLELSDSPFLLGLVSAAGSLPILVLSLPAGALADRVDRRKLLICTRSTVTVLMAIQAILTITGVITVWALILIATLSGIAFAFDIPARFAMVPSLVPRDDLMNAIALNSVVFSGATIVGPAIAGVLVSLIGTGGCFLLTTAGFATLIVMIYMMDVPDVDPAARENSIGRNIVDGLAFIRGNWLISLIILVNIVITVFGMPYVILMPVFAKNVLEVGSQGLGILLAAAGVGSLSGSLAIAAIGNLRHRGLIVVGGVFTYGAMLVLFALSTWLPVSLAFLVMVGLAGTAAMTVGNTMLQSNIPDELQGRVMSFLMLTFGLSPVGSLIAGSIASLTNAPTAIIVGASACMVFSVAIGFIRPSLLKV